MRNPIFAAVLTTAALLASAAFAQQESTNRVAAQTDWSVFVDPDHPGCADHAAQRCPTGGRTNIVGLTRDGCARR
jgi:hypothetical protein